MFQRRLLYGGPLSGSDMSSYGELSLKAYVQSGGFGVGSGYEVCYSQMVDPAVTDGTFHDPATGAVATCTPTDSNSCGRLVFRRPGNLVASGATPGQSKASIHASAIQRTSLNSIAYTYLPSVGYKFYHVATDNQWSTPGPSVNLTPSSISTFLNAVGGGLKDLQFNHLGTPVATGTPVARVIAHACGTANPDHSGTINPEVALVVMQKEKGIITAANPDNSQLMNPMGIGVGTIPVQFVDGMNKGCWVLKRWFYGDAGGYKPSTFPALWAESAQPIQYFEAGGQQRTVTFKMKNAATWAAFKYNESVNGPTEDSGWRLFHKVWSQSGWFGASSPLP